MKILWWYLSIRILYSSYYFPFFQPSYHPYVFLFFFFFSSTHCPSLSLSPFFYLIPVPFLFYLLPHLDEVVSSHSLFFLQRSLSVLFFFTWLQCSHSLSLFFFFSTLSLSLSFLLESALILSFFFTPALSLSVLFFCLIPERGITVKLHWGSFLPLLFLLIWEEKICGPGREIFLPSFPPLLFSSHCQTEENPFFYPIFLPIFSTPPKIHPTKYSVSVLSPSPPKMNPPNLGRKKRV